MLGITISLLLVGVSIILMILWLRSSEDNKVLRQTWVIMLIAGMFSAWIFVTGHNGSESDAKDYQDKYYYYSLMINNDLIEDPSDVEEIRSYNEVVSKYHEKSNNAIFGYFYRPFDKVNLLDYDKAYNSFIRNSDKEG